MPNPPVNPPPAPLPVYKAALDALPDDMRQAYQDITVQAGIDQTDITHGWLVAHARLLDEAFKKYTVEVQGAVLDAMRDFERQEWRFNAGLLIAVVLLAAALAAWAAWDFRGKQDAADYAEKSRYSQAQSRSQ